MINVLVVDDELESFKPGLRKALQGWFIHFAESGGAALDILEDEPGINVVLLDIKMPCEFAEIEEREGIEVLKRIKALRPDMPVIMLTVLTDIDLVVEAIKEGAFHYLPKPFERDRLRDEVERAAENSQLKHQVKAMSRARDATLRVQRGVTTERAEFCGIIGAHPLMQDLYDRIERVAPYCDMTVLVMGETGSGKDLVAHAIHQCSPRSDGPFVCINCAAIAESVLEDELFGHVKGAFTGADSDRDGLFKRAHGGTLFLDEIGDMSASLQSKVLRAIENGDVTPLGGDKTITVDTRIVCATHRDLAEEKDKGEFREDLYYRISDIALSVPPLRRRSEDIPRLVQHFLAQINATSDMRCSIEEAATRSLSEYDWPGNVRQLFSTIRRNAVLADYHRITERQVREDLHLGPSSEPEQDEAEPSALPVPGATPDEETTETPDAQELIDYPVIDDMKEYARLHGKVTLKELLERAIREGGNARAAMALLGMPEERYSAFRQWLSRLEVRVRDLQD